MGVKKLEKIERERKIWRKKMWNLKKRKSIERLSKIQEKFERKIRI